MPGKNRGYFEESQAALRDIMTVPAPSPQMRAGILARRRNVRALLEERQERMALDALKDLAA